MTLDLEKCQNLMDVNVETFEASDGILIQHFNY
jgi:hypothetical protein